MDSCRSSFALCPINSEFEGTINYSRKRSLSEDEGMFP